MYLPKHFEEARIDALHQLVREYPLGTLVTLVDNRLEANHIPFLLQADPLPHGALHGHIARANPLWRQLAADAQALVIFQGPQTFISPSWYSSKRETGKVVPTWNYVVVHAHGHIRIMDDPGWVRAHVEELTNRHESRRPAPWKVTDAPADFIQTMVRAVVGVEVAIEQLQGKWKVSQNRPAKDRAGVVNGLRQEGGDAASAMAGLIEQSEAAAGRNP